MKLAFLLASAIALAPGAARAAAMPVVLTAAGPAAAIPLNRPPNAVYFVSPSLLCLVSSGATLTYNIEVTGETPSSQATWFPLDQSAIGLTGSANFQLISYITGARINVTSYTSGTVTCEVAQ